MVFGRISGGHFNPIVTLIVYIDGDMKFRKALSYILPQFVGSFLAAMIGLPLLRLDKAPYFEE